MKIMDAETEELLLTASRGDADAVQALLSRHRQRLVRMVDVRLDKRLGRRLDASDVVQEALAEAGAKLPDFLRDRPLPFLPWLRRLTLERVMLTYRHHVLAAKRSVGREENAYVGLPDDSTARLIDQLMDRRPDAVQNLIREEERHGIATALKMLNETDREVLVMRYLEHLPFAEIAEALGIGLGAVKMRHLRALGRLRGMLDDPSEETP